MEKIEPYQILYENRYKATIQEYAKNISEIWPQDREKTPIFFWHYIVKHSSDVCENVRKNEWQDVVSSLANVIVWWLSFINHITTEPTDDLSDNIVPWININPNDIVWYKYPGFCSNCFGRKLYLKDKTIFEQKIDENILKNGTVMKVIEELKNNPSCTCLSEKDKVENMSPNYKKIFKKILIYYAVNNKDPIYESMYKNVEMLKIIFSNNADALTIDELAFHLLEEVGEVSTAITDLFMMNINTRSRMNINDKQYKDMLLEREEKVIKFCEELADVFSWSTTLLLKINKYLNSTTKFIKIYYGKEQLSKPFTEALDKIIDNTKNLIDLIWLINKDGNILVCERCKKFPCNPNSEKHKGKRGYIRGTINKTNQDLFKNGSNVFKNYRKV
jgi:NTP pyrophosphatase (non-canonical NTP hydrolase)